MKYKRVKEDIAVKCNIENMKRILPIKKPDDLSHADKCECWTALRLGAALSNEDFLPWYMENFICVMMDQHYCVMHQDKIGSIDSLSLFNEPLTITEMYDKEDIVSQVLQAVDAGGYISVYYDRYFLEGNESFGIVHYLHDMLIYGYDDEKRELYFVDYELDPTGRVRSIDFSIFSQSFYSALEHIKTEKEKYAWQYILNLPGHIMYPNSPNPHRQVNLTKIYESIDKNLRGGEFICETFSEENVIFHTSYLTDRCRYGISIYKGFYEDWFPIIKRENVIQDNFYNLFIAVGLIKLYENKKDLLCRLQYISEEGFKISNNFIKNVDKFTILLRSAFDLLAECLENFDTQKVEIAEQKIKKAEMLDRLILTEAKDYVSKIIQSKRIV